MRRGTRPAQLQEECQGEDQHRWRHGTLREIESIEGQGKENHVPGVRSRGSGRIFRCSQAVIEGSKGGARPEEEDRKGEREQAVGVVLLDLKVDDVGDEQGHDERRQKQRRYQILARPRGRHPFPCQEDAELDGKQKQQRLEDGDIEERVAEQTNPRGYDHRGDRHSAGVEADGVLGRRQIGGADGQSAAAEQALRRGPYEVGQIEQGLMEQSRIEDHLDRQRHCNGQYEQRGQKNR